MRYAIVLASGSGKRMKSSVKKQFIPLMDKPLLFYALKAFKESSTDKIVIATTKEDIDYVRTQIVDKYGISKVVSIVEGGKERYNSVMNALCEIEDGIVAIHDGARPFIEPSVIDETFEAALAGEGASVCAVRVKDTIKRATDNLNIDVTIPRDNLWQIQTPQTFDVKQLKEAYRIICEKDELSKVTDDSMVWEYAYPKKPVKIVESSYFNIKVTTPEDLVFAGAILGQKK